MYFKHKQNCSRLHEHQLKCIDNMAFICNKCVQDVGTIISDLLHISRTITMYFNQTIHNNKAFFLCVGMCGFTSHFVFFFYERYFNFS